jgi:aspartate carbamoyltransferase catalytic subunit
MTNGLLSLHGISRTTVENLFSLARSLKTQPQKPEFLGRTAALLFFEASTRTRLSFESACYRAGLGPLVFQGGAGTSMEKGETPEDTMANVVAMGPSVVVVRGGDDLPMQEFANDYKIPIVNAGWGRRGHPTQALLDLFALSERRSLQGLKVAFLGDLKHSRVAASHLELWPQFGGEVRFCGPASLLPADGPVKALRNVNEAIDWADVVIALRYQLERHSQKDQALQKEVRAHFALTKEHLARIPQTTFILHPGPVNHGVELDTEVYHDPRSLILDQVSHGVWLREALLRLLLKGE